MTFRDDRMIDFVSHDIGIGNDRHCRDVVHCAWNSGVGVGW